MIGENDPAFEVERYENLLVQNLPEKDKTPIFDLVLLGMGDDGHTASIFPNNLKLLRSENFVATAKHPTSGQNRITLTGVTIENALQILFVITGNSKAVVLDEILKEKHNSENYPAFHILKNTKAEIYLDRDASVRLKK
jgi:6-phosphogluconolactonase